MTTAVSLFFVATLSLSAAAPTPMPNNDAKEIAGLWRAKLSYGPDIRGALEIAQVGSGLRAEIAGRSAPVRVVADTVSFQLAGDLGAFIGRFQPNRERIVGHWIQPPATALGRNATPSVLVPVANTWRGTVVPLDAEFTMYLKVTPRSDGTVGAFLKNPERNIGRFIRVDQIERDGETVRLRAADANGQKGRVLTEGVYRDDVLSVRLRGGTYDFERVHPDSFSNFYPRGRPSVPYVYSAPLQRDDGWPTAALEEEKISREGITRFIQMISDERIDSLGAPELQSVLIARHGRLVVEEYFHGEHRAKPHDTRSASKTLATTIAGAAIQAGYPLSLNTPVWATMLGGRVPNDLDARKRAITLEHLLTMASGIDCDDRDEKSPGSEDYVTGEQPDPDWYRYTMNLKAIRNPGEKAVYCSIQPHLAGGVISRAAKQSLPVLFHDLIATPLQITHYGMNLSPTGEPYMGGGTRLTSRDFMKLGQLMLNDGMWGKQRVLPAGWAKRAASPVHRIDNNRKYGYLWWIDDYPYKGRTLQGYGAMGNGGQLTIVIEELDLVVTFNGGSYNDRAAFLFQREYMHNYILPAVN